MSLGHFYEAAELSSRQILVDHRTWMDLLTPHLCEESFILRHFRQITDDLRMPLTTLDVHYLPVLLKVSCLFLELFGVLAQDSWHLLPTYSQRNRALIVITQFFCNSDVSSLSEDCCKIDHECLHVTIIVQMVHCNQGLCGK